MSLNNLDDKITAEDLLALNLATADAEGKLSSLGGSTSAIAQGSAAGFARGAVVFSWDDGDDVGLQIADEHESRGQKATFFITTGWTDTAGFLTSAQVLDLYNRGHEIGAHTVTHPNMTTLTAAQRQTEWDTPKTFLEAIVGAGNVKAFTYPFGIRNATTDQEAYLRYDNISFVGGGANYPNQYGLLLPRPFSSPRLDWGASTYTKNLALKLIELAAGQPIIVQLYAHQPDQPSNPTWAEVRAAMDLAQSLGVPCITQSEAMGSAIALANPGFEDGADGLDGWAPPSLSAGSAAAVVADAPASGMNGVNSIKLDSAADGGWSFVYQIAPATPGLSYTLSGRYRMTKTSGTGGAQLRIRWLDYLGTVISTTLSTVGTSATWAQQTVVSTCPANAAAAFVDVLMLSATGTAYWDHIHFGPTAFGVLG